MPEYRYRCICEYEETVFEPMVIAPDERPKCPRCDLFMWRKPQAVTVHWASGLPPSAGEFSPEIQHHLDNVDEIREETDAYYYERDQNKNA